MAKTSQRFEYSRIAESVCELGMADPAVVQHILTQCMDSGELFTEVLVRENLVADWELSQVACDVFNLPFMPLEVYEPSGDAVDLFSLEELHGNCIVPLDSYSGLLTLAMPVITPSEVLASFAERIGKQIIPVVGSVQSNRRWLMENRPQEIATPQAAEDLSPAIPGEDPSDGDWSQIFDEGDAAVLDSLQQFEEGMDPNAEEAPPDFSAADDLEDLLG